MLGSLPGSLPGAACGIDIRCKAQSGCKPRGLLQPTEPSRGVAGISSADLVLVPALAVDLSGSRLGRGGGSYDRALARVGAAVPTIALLYDSELLDEVPAGPHDQRVRAVAQPDRGITRLA